VIPGRNRRGSEHITFRILAFLVLAMAILLGSFIFAFHREQQKQSSRSMERSAQEVQGLLRVEQAQKVAVMATTLQAITNDGQLAEAFIARDPDALLRRAQPLFEALSREHRITHFYFHTPERVNLLRVHRPGQRGDTINRLTLREAERTGEMASGIERGPIGTFVLRTVLPWRHEGRLLGYVELGVEFEDVVRRIHGLLNVDFVVAVYKQFLDHEQWNRALKTYGRQASWDEFPTTMVMDKTVETIPLPVVEYLADIRTEGRGINHVTSWNELDLQLVFLPLADMSGQMLGELIVLRDVTSSVAQARSSIRFVILICVTVGAALAGLFYLFLTRVEQDLAGRTAKLKLEIIERQRVEAELRSTHEELEQRVADRTRELKEANTGLNAEIASREKAQQELEIIHRQLLETSRQAGMAEVATGVLHNVGNVLNSVNVSATLVADQVRRSKAPNVGKLRDLLNEHRAGLGHYLSEDPKGKLIPDYLATLADGLDKEQKSIIAELESLRKNIDHIKDIVSMQQSYAKTSGVVETVSIPDLIEDALRMNAGSLARHDVDVAREYHARPVITLEKNKALQILVNLVRNAKYACDESGRIDKLLTIRTTADDHCVRIAIVDNGVGIPSENLTRIFAHGFTTRKDGHGFGLHSGALAAKELGGSLTVHSDGPATGATFTLELPFKPEPSKP
jgi:signal transduction histidine kinase